MALDPETFSVETGNVYWRFATTARFGQFDIAAAAWEEDFGPDPEALRHLERALADVDGLYDCALAAAEQAWVALYQGPLRAKEAWGLTRLFADADGKLVLTLYEGDYDTYGAWDVTIVDGAATGVVRRET